MSVNISKTSVALGDEDRRIVIRLVQEKGLNFSSAVRFIIRDWAEMRRFSPTLSNESREKIAEG